MVLSTSALAVFFRDFVHLIGIVLQFWFFLTPIVIFARLYQYLRSAAWRWRRSIRWVNPMATLVDFYHGILYGNVVGPGQVPTPGLPALDSVLRVFVTSLLVLALGYRFFQRNSGKFGKRSEFLLWTRLSRSLSSILTPAPIPGLACFDSLLEGKPIRPVGSSRSWSIMARRMARLS